MKKCFFIFLLVLNSTALAQSKIVVGSKMFTEGNILGEMAAQVVEKSCKCTIERKLGLGNTGMLLESLRTGAIDVYPEYTGTIAENELKNPKLKTVAQIRSALESRGLVISDSLGFDDTYAIAVQQTFADQNQLKTMSDLKAIQKTLRTAFSFEFMNRSDGFNGMSKRYGFSFPSDNVKQMEHSLVYQAINDGAVDAIEVYSTDANIQKFRLKVLEDDLHYFPSYQAVWVARKSFVDAHPLEWKKLTELENMINADHMIAMNAKAESDKMAFSTIASEFLGEKISNTQNMKSQIIHRTREHLWLVGISLLFSILIGVPFGILVARTRVIGQFILIASSLAQTIPALALLCFLIPFFGVGIKPALVALCVYSLLPVVVNTSSGIRSIDPRFLENAKAFGLNSFQILTRITLPLVSPAILSGIKTATIVSIGTATLAALIGAGGYGALIITGLSLNDTHTILMGAIPAAAMALMAYIVFAILERTVISKGIQSN